MNYNYFKNKKILVIGHTGFKGSWLSLILSSLNAKIYGIDYSPNLISIAKSAIPNGRFIVSEVNSRAFKDIKFDIIFSHSVFQYFSTINYANKVLEIWTKQIKSGGRLVLLDLNDKNKEENYHKERMKAYRNPKEYFDAYEGLNHLFFNIDELKKTLKSFGMEHIEVFPHAINNYGNANFRFNLICKKVN